MKDETKWLCEHAQQLEKFAGQWVLFSVNEGVVSNGDSLKKVLHGTMGRKGLKTPFVFFVPSKEELAAPFPALPRK